MAGSLFQRARFMAQLVLTVAKRALPQKPTAAPGDDEILIEAIMTNDLDLLNEWGTGLSCANSPTGMPWFFVALECGGLPSITWFLDHGANPNQPAPSGRLPLQALIQRATIADEYDDHLPDCRSMAAALISAGADPTARTLQGQSLTDLARAAGLF
jgi:hypothetical protein